MEEIKAKTILSKIKYGSDWYGIDYNMNLYRGCSHGCIYCDSRSNCYHIENFDVVKTKENVLLILEKELKKNKTGVIGIGSMSDPYNPQEKKYEITREALKLIQKYHYGVSIDTKSDLIIRDIDLLKEINLHNDVIIKFTITTVKDSLSKIIEPHVCPSSSRLKAIKKLREAGIYVGIMLNPILPFITDKKEDMKELIYQAKINDAKFIHTYLGMTLRENQRDYYYKKLDEFFPGLKEKYQNRYRDKYNCSIPNSKEIYPFFVQECKNNRLLYKMSDIIKSYKTKKDNKQLSFFE